MPERRGRTVLAFDFGLKRIGIAVGEPELRTAHPLGAVTRVDERYSSTEASSRLRGTRAGKGEIDSVAAQLLLEQYFDEAA